MNTIAITTADPVVPFTQNPKQPQPKQQTAKEANRHRWRIPGAVD
jgi:hypothetical protein